MNAGLLPILLLSPVLVAAGVSDLRIMRIPNKLVLIALALFVVTAPLLTWHEIGMRVAAAGIVFAIGFALFVANMFGGGDVKLLAALMLFVPSTALVPFGYIFSFSLLVGIVFIVTLQSSPLSRRLGWVSSRAKGKLPMGISIALAGILLPIVLMVTA